MSWIYVAVYDPEGEIDTIERFDSEARAAGYCDGAYEVAELDRHGLVRHRIADVTGERRRKMSDYRFLRHLEIADYCKAHRIDRSRVLILDDLPIEGWADRQVFCDDRLDADGRGGLTWGHVSEALALLGVAP